jgi:hypothetical protein
MKLLDVVGWKNAIRVNEDEIISVGSDYAVVSGDASPFIGFVIVLEVESVGILI